MSIKNTFISRYVNISPDKINEILIKIRGKSYKESLIILKKQSQKNALVIWKSLHAAVSNSRNLCIKSNIIIAEAFVNRGTIRKKVQPRARGKAFKIEKKTSHITIIIKYL